MRRADEARAAIPADTVEQTVLAMHHRAATAMAESWFRDQILPLTVTRGRKEVVFDTDEHVRTGMSMDDLARRHPRPDGGGRAPQS